MDDGSGDGAGTRSDRRDEKLRKKKQRMAKHSRRLGDLYRQVILKRFRGGGKSHGE